MLVRFSKKCWICNPCLNIMEVVSSLNYAVKVCFFSNRCSANLLCWHKALSPVLPLFYAFSLSIPEIQMYSFERSSMGAFFLRVAFDDKANVLLSFSFEQIDSRSFRKQGSISLLLLSSLTSWHKLSRFHILSLTKTYRQEPFSEKMWDDLLYIKEASGWHLGI